MWWGADYGEEIHQANTSVVKILSFFFSSLLALFLYGVANVILKISPIAVLNVFDQDQSY